MRTFLDLERKTFGTLQKCAHASLVDFIAEHEYLYVAVGGRNARALAFCPVPEIFRPLGLVSNILPERTGTRNTLGSLEIGEVGWVGGQHLGNQMGSRITDFRQFLMKIF